MSKARHGSKVRAVGLVIERQGLVVHLIAHGVTAVRPRSDTFGGAPGDERAQLELPFASRDFH